MFLVSEGAAAPVSQAWAVRIDAPTDYSLLASGMDVGPSGDVYLVGPYRNGGYYLRDILITRRSPSGAPVWQRTYQPPEGPSASEYSSGIVARGTNVYVAASINTSNGIDFLTLKYRDTGELEWAARGDGPGNYGNGPTAIAVDGEGNVLVLGSSSGTDGSSYLVVLKYAPGGNSLWTYYSGGSQGAPRPVEMRVDNAGNIYVAGTTGSSVESSAVTLKLDPNGQELWVATETSANLQRGTANGLDVDSAGNVVTVARDRFYGLIWKYDANGNRLWMAHYRSEEPVSVCAADARFDGNGNIIVSAQISGGALLVKYAADGQELWATRITYPSGYAYLGVLDLDGAGNSYLTSSPGNDVVTVKVNPDGAQLWSVTYNSQESAEDSAELLKVTPSGDIFMAGRSFYSGQTFVSLVKYTQQPVPGVATAVVTPALQVVDPGTDVVLTAETIGPGPFQFQWRKNGRPIPDATHPTLALSNVQALDRADYSVIISNTAGATISPEARLSVRVPPEVSIAPTETLAHIGTDAAFQATISGNDFATLQWRHNGTNIPDATNEVLRLAGLNAEMAGTYDIVVSTFGGSTTSSAAGLKISRALELVETTPYRSFLWAWDSAPQLWVLPNGECFLAGGSNHLMGSSIVLQKRAADGEVLWATTFESAEFTNAEPSRLILDGAGNIYIAGVSRQPYLPAAMVVLKHNPDGQLVWSRLLTGTNLWGSIHDFAVDPNGNSAIAVLGASGTMVNRYDSAGELQWSFMNPPQDDTIALAVDASGNTYLGTTILLRKFDAAGTIMWTVPASDINNRLGKIAVDGAGQLIVAGVGEPSAGSDGWMFIQKYSSAGQKLWETRVGSSWREVGYVIAMAVGPGNEITVLNRSDDDYELGEEAALTRIGSEGQLRYRVSEHQILPWTPSQLALDGFGNAYMTGWGGRVATGADAATVKYDAYGSRHWLVHYDGSTSGWEYGVAVGVDADAEIRVLALVDTQSDQSSRFSLIHYRQLDPASTFRLQLIPGPAGTFHLATRTQEPFRIEASADLQSWHLLTEGETQQLLEPGVASFAASPKRFFRLVRTE